jgi:hypothetical protein
MVLADDLAAGVEGFLGVLGDDLREAALLPFDDDRRTWTYLPGDRAGVALHRLDRNQEKRFHQLLAVLLSLPAFTRAVAIMGLDEVLDRLEGYGSGRRHRGDYWCAVHGTPGAAPWSVRVEGHHVSVRATVVGGEVRATPLFLGANPATVRAEGRVVSAPLAAEEGLGFELLHALGPEQLASAIVADEAPDDITTRDLPRIGEPPDGGVPLASLDGPAADAAGALLSAYLGRFPAGAGLPDPAGARFAWAGAHEPGTGHYYRIAGPGLLIELDNTQDGANHVHTVVRDPRADFGDDLLAAHHREHHRPGH